MMITQLFKSAHRQLSNFFARTIPSDVKFSDFEKEISENELERGINTASKGHDANQYLKRLM